MKPVEQEFLHNPDAGINGDCFRASLASIMDLPITEVPHFMHDWPESDEFNKRLTAFLQSHGFCAMEFFHLTPEWWATWLKGSHIDEIYHLIGGPSPRFPNLDHCVVGRNGMIVHDPHADKSGLGGTYEDWSCLFLVKLCVTPPAPIPKCCVCKTTENLHLDGWYGHRCNSTDCMVI